MLERPAFPPLSLPPTAEDSGAPRTIAMLMVEDNPDDALLIVRELERSGYAVRHERVEREPEYLEALERGAWDVVLSDYALPQFSGPQAFQLLRGRGLDTPFVLVTGRIGEELAAEAMQLGIDRYVWKGNLARLAGALRSTLEDARRRDAQRHTERQLRDREEKLRSLVENTVYSILVHREGTPLFANETLAETFGYGSAAEILALQDVLALFTPDSRTIVLDRLRDGELRPRRPAARTIEGIRRDGSRIWLLWSASCVTWDGATAAQSILVDTTQQRRAEEGLRAQQRLVRTVFDSLPLWLAVKDRAGKYLLVNRELCEAAGKTPEELSGRDNLHLGFGTPEELRALSELDELVMDTGVPREDAALPMTFAGKQVRKLRMIRTPLRDEQSRVLGLVTVSQDITQQASLEEQYRQAQKMESIGRLAGGVAHDFNNILSVILGFTDSLIMQCQGESELLKDLEEVRRAGIRAAELTQQLLAFSRRQFLQLKPLQLNDVIGGLERFVDRLIGEHIQVEYHLAPSLPNVIADEGQIGQVLMNLVVNARDAMPQGGPLTIETSALTVDAGEAARHMEWAPGDYVQIRVKDSGVGMNEQTLLHLFEPFFTTKDKGKGTGLGLATVYGIVKQLNGHIFVESALGEGSAFHVRIPAAAERTEPAPFAASPSDAAPGGATILVVEDDDAVRRAACRVLRDAGYGIIEAGGGQQALDITKTSAQKVDLLLSDIVMPGMAGTELMEQFLELRPGTPVILMSGYSEESIVRWGNAHKARLVQKPFNRHDLIRAVHESLHMARS